MQTQRKKKGKLLFHFLIEEVFILFNITVKFYSNKILISPPNLL